MRAVAILGPNASPDEVHTFDSAAVRVSPLGPSAPLAGADAALVFGGDGTLHRHLRPLSEAKVPVLMVPRGSGNDFARALGVNKRSLAFLAWRRFCAGSANVREVDLAVIRSLAAEGGESVLFCCVGGAGLDAEANRRANRMPPWLRARGGYLLGVLGAVATFQPQRFVVEARHSAEAARIDEHGLLVAFANAPAYGGGIPIAPDALFDDGLLDVIFVRAVSRGRLLRLLPTVFSGAHVRLKEVASFKTPCVRIAPDPPLPVYADGEYVCRTPVEVSVLPKALRVIVPVS